MAIMDEVLRFGSGIAAIGASFVIPNVLIALDKPLRNIDKTLDKRAREREARRVIYYMKSRGYIAGEYKHGLQITAKGQKRLEQLDFDNIKISQQRHWDKLWRIVFYDIPERRKPARDALNAKLREIGFFQLQRSVWVHPFPCLDVIQKVSGSFNVAKYVSYVEAKHIDNQNYLIKLFRKKLTATKF